MSGSIGSVHYYKSLQNPRPTYDTEDEERALRDYYAGNQHQYYSPASGPYVRADPNPKPTAVMVIPRDTPPELLTFKSPLAQRYKHGTESMVFNFSEYKKFVTWRRLWLWLARAQKVYR